MRYLITAEGGGVEPVAAEAESAKEALRRAEEFSERGMLNVTITSADGQAFDLAQFKSVVHSTEVRAG